MKSLLLIAAALAALSASPARASDPAASALGAKIIPGTSISLSNPGESVVTAGCVREIDLGGDCAKSLAASTEFLNKLPVVLRYIDEHVGKIRSFQIIYLPIMAEGGPRWIEEPTGLVAVIDRAPTQH